MINQGDDAELLDREGVRRICPISISSRPVSRSTAAFAPRGGTARHDAVAWGYARGADQRGVDLIQDCEVTGIDIERARHRRANDPRRDPGQEGRDRGCRAVRSGGGDGRDAPAD